MSEPHAEIGAKERIRYCERVTVTRLVVVDGLGVTGDPVREVVHYFDDDGRRIAIVDPWTKRSGS